MGRETLDCCEKDASRLNGSRGIADRQLSERQTGCLNRHLEAALPSLSVFTTNVRNWPHTERD